MRAVKIVFPLLAVLLGIAFAGSFGERSARAPVAFEEARKAPFPAAGSLASVPAGQKDPALENLLRRVSGEIYRLSPKQTNSAIPPLSLEDLAGLEAEALRGASMERRRAALYLLTKSGAAGAPMLAAIARAPVPEFEHQSNPHSVGSQLRSFEISLRITAVEALDQLAADSVSVTKELDSVLAGQAEPTLQLLAAVSLDGVRAGRPGKLGRFIEEMFREMASPTVALSPSPAAGR